MSLWGPLVHPFPVQTARVPRGWDGTASRADSSRVLALSEMAQLIITRGQPRASLGRMPALAVFMDCAAPEL